MDLPQLTTNNDVVELELRHARVDLLRTRLEFGLTYLDFAARTQDERQRHRCVLRAIEALETAYTFPEVPCSQVEPLRDRLVLTMNGVPSGTGEQSRP